MLALSLLDGSTRHSGNTQTLALTRATLICLTVMLLVSLGTIPSLVLSLLGPNSFYVQDGVWLLKHGVTSFWVEGFV